MNLFLKILYYLIAIPAGVVLVVLAVANRHFVSVELDPFNPQNAALTFELPLFVLVFLCLFAGIVIGGLAVWFGQGKWRRMAREEARQLRRLERQGKSGVPALTDSRQ